MNFLSLTALLTVFYYSASISALPPGKRSVTTKLEKATKSRSIMNHGHVIDGHTHLCSPKNWKEVSFCVMMNQPYTGELIVNKIKEANVDQAIALSAAYFFKDHKKAKEENDYTAEQVRLYPNKLIGFCSVNASADWAIEEVERCITKLKLKGLKMHFVANNIRLHRPKDNKKIAKIFSKISELKPGFPILVDFYSMNDAETAELERLAMMNPYIKIILAHALVSHHRELAVVALYRKISPLLLSNIYVDLSGSIIQYSLKGMHPAEKSIYLQNLRLFGMDRVFFGSDYPAFSIKDSKEALINLGLTEDEIKAVMGKNMKDVFSF